MRTRTTVVLGLIVAMFVPGWFAGSAVATPPTTLSSEFVTDDAGVLNSSELSAANERLSKLAADDGGDLYMVFVDEFTDPSDSVAWTDDTARDNGLGADQYLIAVAVDAGQYAISADDSGPLNDSQIDAVVQAMENGLRAGDWDGAVIAAADAFPGQSGAAGGSFGGILWILIPLVIVVIVIVLVVRAVKKKKKRGAQPPIPDPNDPYASVSDDDLQAQAGTALVEADDSITSSRQEVGFAIAQYGEDSTAAFTKVVDAAKAKVSAAFTLKQQLDDENPETDAERRAMHIQIIQLCDEADDILEANVDAFEELRKLEAEAPQSLERVKARRATAEQMLATVEPALATLRQMYDAAALATVNDNSYHSQQRLALADSEIAEAAAAVTANQNGEAAFSIRTAEEAVAQSEQLIAAVTTLGANLAAVEDQARTLIGDLEADIAAAGALSEAQGSLAPMIARTRTRIDAAQSNLQGTSRNPQQVLDELEAANSEIDAAVEQARESAERAQRAQRTLQQRLTQAQAQISSANDFIVTRRGAIGATARTRLAEAGAAYNEALSLQATDIVAATERATRAYTLASQALSSAQAEVSSFQSGGWGGGAWSNSSYNQGYDRNSGGLGGDILGGILGGLFSGGGGGGGSWRSSSGSRSSRSSRASSFGSSRSSRRSSRSSSSRGRSRGGRF